MPELGFDFQVKSVAESGVFEGLASVYGVRDLGGDVVAAGAFDQTLRRKGPSRILLWSHDSCEPIGVARLADSSEGLQVRGELDLDVESGRNAYSRVRKGISRGLSIGYKSVRDQIVDGARHLLELDLYEVSLCCFPMNEQARVHSVKGQIASKRDFERWLHDGGWSKSEAKRLAAHGWPADDDEDDDGDEAEGLLAWLKAQKSAQQVPW